MPMRCSVKFRHLPSFKSAMYSFCMVCLFLAVKSSAVAQTGGVESLEWYQQTTRVVLANARNLIEPLLDEREREVARAIEYRVTSSGGLNAFAATENGRQVIVVHAGLIQMMAWFYDLISMETIFEREGCLKEYIEHLYPVLQENQYKAANQLPLKRAPSPATYGATTTGACSGLTSSDFASNSDYVEQRPRQIEASIMFIYLHELGHHIHQHTSRADLRRRQSLEMTRHQEDEADNFAVLTALKAGYFLTAATPFYSYASAFSGNSLEAEKLASHPLGLKRILQVFDRTVTYLKENPTTWRNRSTYSRLMRDLEDDRDKLQDQVSRINPY